MKGTLRFEQPKETKKESAAKFFEPVKSGKTLGGFVLMAVRKTELLTKTELTSLLNRQNYKSIELFENVNPDLIELLKKVKRSDGVRVLVIKKVSAPLERSWY